jgi:hypothetical protein
MINLHIAFKQTTASIFFLYNLSVGEHLVLHV